MDLPVRRGAAEWLIAACGIRDIGHGMYFIFLRPALLPEDVRYMGADLQALQPVAPRLAGWLAKVFTVMGGFMPICSAASRSSGNRRGIRRV